jgi:long-subunit fatty acid transport protein
MRKSLIAIAILAATPALFAQVAANESLLGLQFNVGNPGARSLGMGGAFVALADDASAAEANPAGLTILQRPEVSVEARSSRVDQTFNATGDFPDLTTDSLQSYSRRAEVSFASVVIPAGKFAIAGYYHQPVNFTTNVALVAGPIFYFVGPNGPVNRQQCIDLGDGCDAFQLLPYATTAAVSMKTMGVASAFKVGGLSLGGAIRYHKFSQNAATVRTNLDFDPIAIAGQTADDHDLTWSAGFKYAMGERISIGGVYKRGAEFDASQSFAFSGADPVHFDARFHTPDAYGIGIAIRPLPVLTLAAEAQKVKYSNLSESIVTAAPGVDPSDLGFEDTTEIHFGGEYFLSTKIPVAIRGGYWREPTHDLRYNGPLVNGNQIGTAIIFPGTEDQNHISGGIGLAWPRFQIDAAYDTSKNNKIGSISFVTRF